MSASLLDQGKTILNFCLCAEVTPLIHGVQVLALHALKVLAPTSSKTTTGDKATPDCCFQQKLISLTLETGS